MTHPTDALRLVLVSDVVSMIEKMTAKYGNPIGSDYEQGVQDHGHRIRAQVLNIAAAPASPLPEGGGQCSGISGELDPRLVEWGYTSLDEAITHLGKLLDDHTAFDGLGDMIAELREAMEALIAVKISADHMPPMSSTRRIEWRIKSFNPAIALVRAFLARNGKGEG